MQVGEILYRVQQFQILSTKHIFQDLENDIKTKKERDKTNSIYR